MTVLFRKIVVACGLSLLAGVAQANLVVNGSFELTAVPAKSYFSVVNPTGWSGGGNLTFVAAPGTADDGGYLSVYGPFPTVSPDGGNFVQADGDSDYSGAFSQTVEGLTVGRSYSLTFYQAAGQQLGFTSSTTERWSVTFGSQSRLSTLVSLPSGGIGPWTQEKMLFTASAPSQVLTFLAVGTPSGAPPVSFLDGVSITAVPEPATLSLFGLGVLLVGASRLHRPARAIA